VTSVVNASGRRVGGAGGGQVIQVVWEGAGQRQRWWWVQEAHTTHMWFCDIRWLGKLVEWLADCLRAELWVTTDVPI
jgi:hypothetical protein